MRTVAFLSTLAVATSALANDPSPTGDREPVYGWLEKAVVLPVGALVNFKLDSGALTSSMDARDIRTFQRQGQDWVSFRLELEDEVSGELQERELRLPVERVTRIRGAGGEDVRPVVKLPVCIGNRVLHEEFTLRDRDNMNHPVLLGRRTVEQLGLLDVSATYLNEPDCPLARGTQLAAPGGEG